MKEMIATQATTEGGSVKKTLIVAAVAAALVLCLSGSAFAAGINHSGQMRTGPGALANASSPTSASIAGGGSYTYLDWTNLGTNASNGNSPHGNYTTTTVKCVVCHAVHYAAPGGAPVGSGQTADTLLRMRADQACVYCHATDGMAVNGRPVYNGQGGAIVGPGNTGGATNAGHITGTNCTYCHTNVHAAGADNSVASLQGFLLKTMTATNVQNQGVTTTNMLEAITAIDHNAVNQGFNPGDALAGTIGQYASTNSDTMRQQAIGVFCAECHLGAYATGTNGAGAATNIQGSATASFTGHRIAVTGTNNWNATGNISSGAVQNQQVAWAPATNCKSCHDAKDDYGNAAFPHAWGTSTSPAKMWLLASPDAGTAGSSVGTPSLNAYDGSRVQLSDGVCLKCHVASGGAAGVGVTF
jgi:hypothetical protein